jgi:hypothetical protein
MSESSTELTVLDRPVGEIVDVRTASTLRLAEWVDALTELRRMIAEEEDAVQRELVARLDHEAATTLREGDFELKVPGANAGTVTYDSMALDAALDQLVIGDEISETAALGAFAKGLVIEVSVPWWANPEEMRVKLTSAVNIEIADVPVTVIRCAPVRKPSVAGVNRLRKLPNVGESLDYAKVTQEPPRRRVKVTYKGRG